MIAQAQSGTGKTATFVITILQQLEVESRDCQALVLAPTRELAQQVNLVVKVTCFKYHVIFICQLFYLSTIFK